MKVTERSFKLNKFYYTNEHLISSFEEYMDYINFLIITTTYFEEDVLWYRGESSSKYKEVLRPSIYRTTVWEDEKGNSGYNKDKATSLFKTFKNKAKGYLDNKILLDWEWYFIMQHYGLPTRLLDWTEGHLLALYFAIRNTQYIDEPCVWIIDPIQLNKLSHDQKQVYFIDNGNVDKYLNDDNLPDGPVAIYPPYEDNRIRVQKSCFTIHGKEQHGFGKMYKRDNKFNLIQLRIKNECARDIKSRLHYMGISDSVIFPDLEGLARELKYINGME